MEKKLRELIKESMFAKKSNPTSENTIRYQTFKNILETAQKIAKEKKVDITDSMIFDAAKKEIKQLNDLMEYISPDDSARILDVTESIKVAEEILPKMASEDEIKNFIVSHKEEANNIGTMMKLLKIEFGDALDGKLASKLIKEML